jgi:hypothetical protein
MSQSFHVEDNIQSHKIANPSKIHIVPKLNLNKINGEKPNTNNQMDNSFIEKSFLEQLNTTLLNDVSYLDILNKSDDFLTVDKYGPHKTEPHNSLI